MISDSENALEFNFTAKRYAITTTLQAGADKDIFFTFPLSDNERNARTALIESVYIKAGIASGDLRPTLSHSVSSNIGDLTNRAAIINPLDLSRLTLTSGSYSLNSNGDDTGFLKPHLFNNGLADIDRRRLQLGGVNTPIMANNETAELLLRPLIYKSISDDANYNFLHLSFGGADVNATVATITYRMLNS
jgi:hypothetical protein